MTGSTNTRRLKGKIWGDSMVNKLPSRSRKRRKRQASKVRRVLLIQELRSE
jgi:hypothetical protein